MKRFTLVAIMVLMMLAIGGGAAQAQAPTGNGYNPNNVLEDVDRIPPKPGRSVDPEPPQRERGGSLPFTGLDVGFLALGGVAMLGVGVGLRRLSRTSS